MTFSKFLLHFWSGQKGRPAWGSTNTVVMKTRPSCRPLYRCLWTVPFIKPLALYRQVSLSYTALSVLLLWISWIQTAHVARLLWLYSARLELCCLWKALPLHSAYCLYSTGVCSVHRWYWSGLSFPEARYACLSDVSIDSPESQMCSKGSESSIMDQENTTCSRQGTISQLLLLRGRRRVIAK